MHPGNPGSLGSEDYSDRCAFVYECGNTVSWPLFQDSLGKPAPERLILDFNEARGNLQCSISWTIS